MVTAAEVGSNVLRRRLEDAGASCVTFAGLLWCDLLASEEKACGCTRVPAGRNPQLPAASRKPHSPCVCEVALTHWWRLRSQRVNALSSSSSSLRAKKLFSVPVPFGIFLHFGTANCARPQHHVFRDRARWFGGEAVALMIVNTYGLIINPRARARQKQSEPPSARNKIPLCFVSEW